jgi:putative peptide zinc metalloprotease protein
MEGVVEPLDMQVVYARSDGFVDSALPSGSAVQAGRTVLVSATNPKTDMDLKVLQSVLEEFQAKRHLAQMKQENAEAFYLDEAIKGLRRQIEYVQEQETDLKLTAPLSGLWVAPEIDHLQGTYLKREQQVGVVISDHMIIRAVAPQDLAPRLKGEEGATEYPGVEVRVRGRPEELLDGKISKVYPAGSERLPSAALSYAVGGSYATDPKDQHGTKASEKFVEVQIDSLCKAASKDKTPPRLFSGQRVMVRVELPAKPLASQWWRKLRQMIQQKFQM